MREKVELWLAWKRVEKEILEGTLGGDFDRADRADVRSKVADAEEAVKDEIWGSYRFAVIADNKEKDGIKAIDLGAGHSSGSDSLCGRVIVALKSQALLNESVGAGYIDRNWPPALKESGAWPLTSLRQSFLNGSLTRLLDPDTVLKTKIVEFVGKGDFGLASGQRMDGSYDRVWYEEPILSEEVAFEAGVFLLTRNRAKVLKTGKAEPKFEPGKEPKTTPEPGPQPETQPIPGATTRTLRLVGTIPPEVWNRLGTKILPKLRSGMSLSVGVDFSITLSADTAQNMENELRQILTDLGLTDKVRIE
jgi:hypothetical protein